MTFAEKIKELRKQKGLNQEQASKKIGIATSSLRNYENGRLPDTYQMKLIKNFYNVSYEYLVDDSIENKLDEDIKIEKELGLSSLSIKKILDLKKDQLSNTLNLFIEKTNIENLIYRIHEIHILENQWENNISFLIQLYDFSDFLEENLNDTNNNEIINIFSLFNTKMSNFCKFIDCTEIDLISITECEKFRQSLRSIQDIFISGNANDFKLSLIQYTIICIEITEKVKERIDFNKYRIQLLITDFYNTAFSNTDECHYQDLKDYYKYKNKDLYFTNAIINHFEENIKNFKKNNKIGDVKGGSTRSNKK